MKQFPSFPKRLGISYTTWLPSPLPTVIWETHHGLTTWITAGLVGLKNFRSLLSSLYSHPTPIDHLLLPPSLWLRIVYLLQLSNYIAALILLNSRKHHKDYYIMATHHLVTIALISLSYSYSMFRVGSMVLIVHDVSDIFLELGKCFNYIGWDTAKSITFAIFATTFFVSRLIIFPARVLVSVFIASYTIIGEARPLGLVWDLLLASLQVRF